MDAFVTLVTALEAWKWPLVVVVALLLFRRAITEALARLRRGKISQFEFELDELVEKAVTAEGD